ncbi:MAG: hypothetical protein PHD56_03425 [Anaerostipes sp.]|jgi:hypothetical protein|nr:hypothetical protein [Anaerostipes sp.]
MHAYFSELVTYLIKFVFLIVVGAGGGIFVGRKLALNKKAKSEQDA